MSVSKRNKNIYIIWEAKSLKKQTEPSVEKIYQISI